MVPIRILIAELHGLVGSGGGSTGHGGAPEHTLLGDNVYLNGRGAAAVENLAGGDAMNGSHSADGVVGREAQMLYDKEMFVTTGSACRITRERIAMERSKGEKPTKCGGA
jgi:hypothetical protein